VRAALARYSVWAESTDTDLRDLLAVDLGDIVNPDGDEGEARTREALTAWTGQLLVAIGGDNSLTYAVAAGLQATGMVTLDAHHDLRDGRSNGSPVARLIADGLIDPRRIVQVGISDFANAPDYARQARDLGIKVITRSEVARTGIVPAMTKALAIAGDGPAPRVHVDLDVDVCDRAAVPACPAAAPGGISAWELREAARSAGRDRRVVGVDFTEVDAAADTPDARTVRLVALGVLEVAAGLANRRARTLTV
jgi:formiminoglutamase